MEIPKNKRERLELIAKKEKKLAELADEIYQLNMGGRRLHPIHPYIIVRVLPKEARTNSGLYLPGNIQNKPVYEGIVIETWKSFVEHRLVKGKEIQVWHECGLKPGQRVLFPHYEGQGMKDILDDKYYRVIREGTAQHEWAYCSVLGTMDYEGDADNAAEIRKLSEKFYSRTVSGRQDPNAPHWEPPEGSNMFTS